MIFQYKSMVSWSYDHCHVHQYICYKEVCRNVLNPCAVVPLFKASGYFGFWWYFNTKVWSVYHMIIVIFSNGYAIRGAAEISQSIRTQLSHFSKLLFILMMVQYKVWTVDHIINVMFIIRCGTQVSAKFPKFILQWSQSLTAVRWCRFWWYHILAIWFD